MLQDLQGRHFQYLRLSVTDVCNFKCIYCLPNGYCKSKDAEAPLTAIEIQHLLTAFAEIGFQKVRFTGGEPSTRSDLTLLIRLARTTPGISQIALTTNGWNLKTKARGWKDAGLDAINVSIDSLDEKRFQEITGTDKLKPILEGCEEALHVGFKNLKVNAVLLKGMNDQDLESFCEWVKTRPITVRFIELMQTADSSRIFKSHHTSGAAIRSQLVKMGWKLKPRAALGGPAAEFTHPDYQGGIGTITPYENHFCESCNRLRVSSEGKLRLCLFGTEHFSLRPWLQSANQKDALIKKVRELISFKDQSHHLKEGLYGKTQNFSEIGG